MSNWNTTVKSNPQRRKAVDKLLRIANDEPLDMDKLEEPSMLIVCADPKDTDSPNYNGAQVCWFTHIKHGNDQLTAVQYLNGKFFPECSTKPDKQPSNLRTKSLNELLNG